MAKTDGIEPENDEYEQENMENEEEQLRGCVANQRNPNTNKKTEQVISKFTDFLMREMGEGRNADKIPPVDLHIYKGSFIMNLKILTVGIMSLTA